MKSRSFWFAASLGLGLLQGGTRARSRLVDALDYVVKPIRKERLAAALERARTRLAASTERPVLDAATLQKAGVTFGYVPVAPSRLLVRHGAGHRLTLLSEATGRSR